MEEGRPFVLLPNRKGRKQKIHVKIKGYSHQVLTIMPTNTSQSQNWEGGDLSLVSSNRMKTMTSEILNYTYNSTRLDSESELSVTDTAPEQIRIHAIAFHKN